MRELKGFATPVDAAFRIVLIELFVVFAVETWSENVLTIGTITRLIALSIIC